MATTLLDKEFPELKDLLDSQACHIASYDVNTLRGQYIDERLKELEEIKDLKEKRMKIEDANEIERKNDPIKEERIKLKKLEEKIEVAEQILEQKTSSIDEKIQDAYRKIMKESKEENLKEKIDSQLEMKKQALISIYEEKQKQLTAELEAKIKELENKFVYKEEKSISKVQEHKEKEDEKSKSWIKFLENAKTNQTSKMNIEINDLKNKKTLIEQIIEQKLTGTETKKLYVIDKEIERKQKTVNELNAKISECNRKDNAIDCRRSLLSSRTTLPPTYISDSVPDSVGLKPDPNDPAYQAYLRTFSN
jgi:DNA repair exonuclease SbcCD ATPase subunit